METTLIVILVILTLCLLTVIGMLTFFAYKFYKLQSYSGTPGTVSQSVNDALSRRISDKEIPSELLAEIERDKNKLNDLPGHYCSDHPELVAKGKCSISDQMYCELCLTKENDIRIARKYLDMLLDSNWNHTYMLNNEQVGADKLNELIKLKKEIWRTEQIPLIVQKQFKINIEKDRIEAYTVVMARESEEEIIKKKFSFLEN